MSGALVPANGGPSFPQQGSMDWVQLSRSSLTMSIELLARLSRAGVETITIAMGQMLCSQFHIPADTQRRINLAISKLRVKSSYNNILYFGFGVKNTVRSLVETEQGIACVAICGCLATSYDQNMAAQVLRDMAQLRSAPEDLTPSLAQWSALINTCSPTLAASDFPNIVEGFSRLWRESPDNGKLGILRGAAAAPALSNALNAIANVSNKSLINVTVAGGPDCAWVAAIAEWVLCLRIDIVTVNGQLLYSNYDHRENGFVQVTIVRDTDNMHGDYLVDRAYIVPSGSPIWDINLETGHRIFSHGRSTWSTILQDTFGPTLRRFLDDGAGCQFFDYISKQYGAEVLEFALKRLPELQISHYFAFPEASYGHCTSHISNPELEISSLCSCSDCEYRQDPRRIIQQRFTRVCLDDMFWTLAHFILLLRECNPDSNIQPSSTGLGLLYRNTKQNPGYLSVVINNGFDLPNLFEYLTGMSSYGLESTRRPSALSRSGVTLYSKAFHDPDLEPLEQRHVQVIPGYIEKDHFSIEEVYDLYSLSGTRRDYEDVEFLPFVDETFNFVTDNSRRNLPLSLMVKETLHFRKLQASYVWHFADTQLPSKIIQEGAPFRTLVAFGPAQLRRLLMKSYKTPPCQQALCNVRIQDVPLKGRCYTLLPHTKSLPRQSEVVLVREGELREPYSFEESTPATRIQRSRQIRILYTLLCNPAGPTKALLIKFEDHACILCAAGWKSSNVVVDADPCDGVNTNGVLEQAFSCEILSFEGQHSDSKDSDDQVSDNEQLKDESMAGVDDSESQDPGISLDSDDQVFEKEQSEDENMAGTDEFKTSDDGHNHSKSDDKNLKSNQFKIVNA